MAGIWDLETFEQHVSTSEPADARALNRPQPPRPSLSFNRVGVTTHNLRDCSKNLPSMQQKKCLGGHKANVFATWMKYDRTSFLFQCSSGWDVFDEWLGRPLWCWVFVRNCCFILYYVILFFFLIISVFKLFFLFARGLLVSRFKGFLAFLYLIFV